jgi:hypothetical protein
MSRFLIHFQKKGHSVKPMIVRMRIVVVVLVVASQLSISRALLYHYGAQRGSKLKHTHTHTHTHTHSSDRLIEMFIFPTIHGVCLCVFFYLRVYSLTRTDHLHFTKRTSILSYRILFFFLFQKLVLALCWCQIPFAAVRLFKF